MKLSHLIVILLIFVEAQLGWAQSTLDFPTGSEETLDMTNQIEISVQDPSQSQFETFQYQKNASQDLKLRYTSQALWIRFRLQNPTSKPQERMLYLTSGLTGVLELYREGSVEPLQKAGSSVPFLQRSVRSRLPAFRIELASGQSQTFYLKRLSHHNLSSKVFLSTPEAFYEKEMDSKATLFFYVGGLLCLVVYNLFIGVSARDINYFYYAFFTSALALTALNMQGFIDSYMLTHQSFTASHYLMAFSSTAIVASLLFVYHFLNIPQTFPKANAGFWILGILGLLLFIEGIFPIENSQVIFGHLIDGLVVVLLCFLVTCGVVVYRRGYKLAQFFLLSWVSMIVGVLGWFGMTYGLLHHSAITSHALMFGNLGEMLVLSLGLAYKINTLDKEKRRAELQAQEKERYHRLVKVLSHDVANSISIFSGYLRRLQKSLDPHPELATIGKLEAVVENMKGILDLVRGEEALKSFQISATLKPVNLREVLQEVAAFYEEACTQKGLKLEMEIPENLFVMADKTALSNQVLSNVISNAIKFSHPQSKISITVETKDHCIYLKVRDFGVGILPEEVKRIFFSEEMTSKPGTLRERGSGLGASLVKDYMAIFKGRIEVSSIHESVSSDCGTLITLVFPQILS